MLLPFVVLFISFLIGDPTPPTRTQSLTSSLPTSTSSKTALVTEQVLDQIRGYISEGRLGTAISTAEKYDLSQNAELTKLHANASVMLAAKKQEAADRVIENAIKASDDFGTYKNAFLTATSTLIENGTCTVAEFKEMGGWVRSQAHKPKSVYFMYCGGMTVRNRIYLDVNNGKIFR